jgi:3-oxoadipate enol-lactonase
MADMVVGLDLFPELSKIACPTLIIGATQDTQRPPALMKEIAEKIPGARYVEADTGHFMAVETPDLFVEMVVPFLRERPIP